MEKDLRELRVFMASPSDLTDERDALRNLERRLNSMFRARGVRVSIEGWEEVQPDAGAPQDLINPLVHSCDVFVGLLSARWGTPTDNDSSGFSEEFNIALQRRKESGVTPTIGMYFRDIELERLRDKGPQLEAVLAFKERVEAERLVLHKTFGGADHLALEVMNFLLPHVLRLADEVSVGSADLDAGSSGSTSGGDEPETLESADPKMDAEETEGPAGSPDAAQAQVVSALSSFSNLFLGAASADPSARDRVTLVALAFAQDVGALGSHHINRLYRSRRDLALTLGEARIWYRTFFQNYGSSERDHRIVPIWGALGTERQDDRLASELAAMLSDDDQNVVRGALRFMTQKRVRPESLWEPAPEVASQWIRLFERFPGADVVLNYIIAVAQVSDGQFLTSLAESDPLDERSKDLLRVAVDSLVGDVTSLYRLAPTRYSGTDTLSLRAHVLDAIPRFSADQWDDLLRGTHRQIAIAAALHIVEHEDVSSEQSKTISELGSAEVEEAYIARATRDPAWGARQVAELTTRDKYGSAHIISRLLAATLPKEDLEALDREETLDASAWVALTIQDPSRFLESSREVLDGRAEWLNERNAPLQEKFKAIAVHTAATARAAACFVLSQAVETNDEDVERVVAELRRDHYLSRSAAFRALATMASRYEREAEKVFPELRDLSVLDSQSFVEDSGIALASPLATRVVPIWLESNVEALQHEARDWLLRQPERSDAELEEALHLDDESLRMVAIDQLLARWSDQQLHELLDRYGNQDRPWWYNVIAALDERLYCVVAGSDEAEQVVDA